MWHVKYSSCVWLVWFNISKSWKNSKIHHIQSPFLRSSLPPYTKILGQRIYVRVKTSDIENQYDKFSITCADESSILEGVYFTVSYAPLDGISSLHIIIEISSSEVLIIFVLDVSNDFQNTILPNPEEIIYLSLPHLYL